MSGDTTYQFFITESQFMTWARDKKVFVDMALLTHKTALETLYTTVFPYANDYLVTYSDDGTSMCCIDVDLISDERSIEIIRAEPDSDHGNIGAIGTVFQVTVTDTTENSARIKAIVEQESLLDGNYGLEDIFVYRMRHQLKPTQPTGKNVLKWLSAILLIGVIAVACSR